MMYKTIIAFFLLISQLSFGQKKYRQILDSLKNYSEQLSFTIDPDQRKSSLLLISKYHPAYIPTVIGDGKEIVTEEMIRENKVYKALSKNKKSVIILSSKDPGTGWIVVIDLKQLDTSSITLTNDTITLSAPNGFKCNVYHRLWKGLIETKSIKVFVNNDLSQQALLDKTYHCLRLVISKVNQSIANKFF